MRGETHLCRGGGKWCKVLAWFYKAALWRWLPAGKCWTQPWRKHALAFLLCFSLSCLIIVACQCPSREGVWDYEPFSHGKHTLVEMRVRILYRKSCYIYMLNGEFWFGSTQKQNRITTLMWSALKIPKNLIGYICFKFWSWYYLCWTRFYNLCSLLLNFKHVYIVRTVTFNI